MKHITLLSLISILLLTACSEPDSASMLNISVDNNIPVEGYTIESGRLVFDEINTDTHFPFDLPLSQELRLPVGVYNVSGEMTVRSDNETYHLKTVLYQYTLTSDSAIRLNWLRFNPQNTLVFGEMYFTGSLNAKGTGGLYDTYLTIYNNTDEIQYADGLALVESKLTNVSTDLILTPESQRDKVFTAQAVYVIPGTGKDVPIAPGESIKIVDQAIDWSASLSNALNHLDADFEWFDESSSASVVDTDNPEVKNLDKWFCYTLTIWIPSNQCNRSYALVRMPEGMTMERFLVEQQGEYDYVNSATGTEMHATKCYRIPLDWIIDGVNLCPEEKFTEPVLPASIDRGYAAISPKNSDVNRFGKKFVRKRSGIMADGRAILQDTDNSADDFEIVAAK